MSKKKECPSCGLEVNKNANKCTYCGYEFPERSSGKKVAAYVLIFLLIIWLIFGTLF